MDDIRLLMLLKGKLSKLVVCLRRFVFSFGVIWAYSESGWYF